MAYDLAYGALLKQYEEHRVAIDRIVQMATDRISADENNAALLIKSRNKRRRPANNWPKVQVNKLQTLKKRPHHLRRWHL